MLKKEIYFLFMITFLFCVNLFSNDKTSSATFLRIYSSPKIVSMGGVGNAINGDISNNEINPSNMYWIKTDQLYFSYTSWFEDINISYLGFAIPMGENSVLGFSAKNLDVKDIEGRDINGVYTGNFGAEDNCYTLSFMQSFLHRFSLGCNIKFITEKIDIYSDTTIAYDLGLLLKLNENFVFACACRNIGDGLKLYSEEFSLPMTYTFGIGYLRENKYNLELGLEKEVDCDIIFRAGIEIFVLDILSFRLGGIHTKEYYDSDDFTLGLGINLNERWYLDYAYLPFSDFDNTHRFAIKLNF